MSRWKMKALKVNLQNILNLNLSIERGEKYYQFFISVTPARELSEFKKGMFFFSSWKPTKKSFDIYLWSDLERFCKIEILTHFMLIFPFCENSREGNLIPITSVINQISDPCEWGKEENFLTCRVMLRQMFISMEHLYCSFVFLLMKGWIFLQACC